MAGLPWGEVSKWVALLTLTLVGVMDQKNGRARNRQRPLAAIVSVLTIKR